MSYVNPPTTVLGFLTGINLNATGDNAISIRYSKYVLLGAYLYDFSTTPGALTTATLRDAASGGGNSLVGSLAALNGIATTALGAHAIPTASALGAVRQSTASTLYLNVSVANGSALTCSVVLHGLAIP